MAKVEGPLFSLGARGAIAKAMVFFPWKGRHVVRRWVIPTNPQSTLQGYVRVALKAIGKFIGKVVSESTIQAAAVAGVPAGLNWNAWLGGGFLELLQSGNAIQTASWQAIVDEYSSLGTTDLAAFAAAGTSLGIVDFALGYGYTANIPAGLQVYMGAKAVVAREILTTSPYNVPAVSWVVADVVKFQTDIS